MGQVVGCPQNQGVGMLGKSYNASVSHRANSLFGIHIFFKFTEDH